jgi:serine/threonine protein kinase
VTIYQLGEDNGIQFIAMEFIEGDSLAEYIEKSLPSLAEAIFIFYKILNGVQALHSKGIIHRDLKPKNIMVPSPKNVKIVDFGIAEFINFNNLTNEKRHAPVGSVSYLSPEIISGSPATVQSDIWSLGVILYKILTGINPFTGKDRNATMQNILKGDITYQVLQKISIPTYLINIIQKMCAVDLDQRYKSVDEIIFDLKSNLSKRPPSLFTENKMLAGLGIAFLFFGTLYWVYANKTAKKTPIASSEDYIKPKSQDPIIELKPKDIPDSQKNITNENELKTITKQIEAPLKDDAEKEIRPEITSNEKINPSKIRPDEKTESVPEKQLTPPVLSSSNVNWLLDFKNENGPRNIASSQGQTNSNYKLGWKKNADAARYKIQISNDKSFNDLALETEITPNVFIWNRPKLGMFFWRVKSIGNSKNSSGYSTIGTLKVTAQQPSFLKNKYRIVFDSKKGKNEVTLQWSDLSAVNQYAIQLIPIKGNLEKKEYITQEPTVNIPVDSLVKFKAKVTALDDKRKPASQPSLPVEVDVVSAQILQTPKLVYPLNNTLVPSQSTMITPIVCKWLTVPNAEKYVYQISEDADAKKVLSESTHSENGILITLPLSKGRYFWRVKSIGKDGGESSWSSMFSFFID